MKQLILILTIAMLTQQTYAHESSFVCVKKGKTFCLKYNMHTHQPHFKRERMVSINNKKYRYYQPKNVITESIAHIEAHKHNHKHEPDVLDTIIKIAIIKELLD